MKQAYQRILSLNTPSFEVASGDPLAGTLLEPNIPSGCNLSLAGCSAGFSGITITGDGSVMPCRRIGLVAGNVKRKSLRSIWASSRLLWRLRERKSYTGVIQFDPPDLTQLSVEAEIDVKNLTTGLAERDEHLLSPDYFDAEKYPKILFKSTRVEAIEGNRGKVTGDLTIRGIKRPVTLDFEFSGPVKSPFSGITCIGFSATGKVMRGEYGMTWNETMEGGGVVTGTQVRINMEVEADLMTD